MTAPRRLKLSRTRGASLPPGAVSVARPSRRGNPYRLGGLIREPGPDGAPAAPLPRETGLPEGQYPDFTVRRVRDRADAVTLFQAYVSYQAQHDSFWSPETIQKDLGGRDLACYCPPAAAGKPDNCHATVLIEIANPSEAAS